MPVYHVNNESVPNVMEQANSFLETDNPSFVLFHMNGCGPCSQTLPEWKRLENDYGDDELVGVIDVEMSKLNDVRNEKLKDGVMGFPTMRYVRNGVCENYEDCAGITPDRSYDSFKKWIVMKEKNKTKLQKRLGLGIDMLGGKKRRTRKHKNARGGGGCMSTGACMSTEPDEYSSRVFSRKKVHWDTGKIESESGKTPYTIDSVDEFKRNHESPPDKTIFGSKEWFDSYSSAGGKSKKTTQPGKLGGKRKTRKSTKTKKRRKPRSKKQKGGNIYSELLRAMLLQIGEYGPREGDWEAVKRLLDQGADINKAMDDGTTPLYIASYKGHVEVVRFLAERGADINKADNGGWSPLLIASQNGHAEVVSILVDGGADINQVEGEGATPLLIASVYDHVEVVRILTEKGADINKADNDGATPLFAASVEGDVEVVRILAERGADINKADKYVYTPLYAASQAGHVDVVRFLTEKGADINKADNDGATPLFAASVYDHVEVVRILTEKGADINKADNDGITPLSIAVSEGYTEIVNILKPYIQIPVMTEEEFKTCDKNNEEKITCGITLDVLNRKNAVKPEVETEVDPNGNAIVVVDNNQCFERSALQEWLKIQKIHPLTRKKITNKWINKWYPLGVNALYSAQTGGKKRRTRKHINARGGGADADKDDRNAMSSSKVFLRKNFLKKVDWDTSNIESESEKTSPTTDSTIKSNDGVNTGGKSKKTTKRRKVTKRRQTIKRKPRKKPYNKKRQTKRRSARSRSRKSRTTRHKKMGRRRTRGGSSSVRDELGEVASIAMDGVADTAGVAVVV